MNNQKFRTFEPLTFSGYLSPLSSSGSRIVSVGSLKSFLFAIVFSNESNREGNSNKLESIANKRVTETKPPSAIVPPKLDTVNTKNPKNNTMEV